MLFDDFTSIFSAGKRSTLRLYHIDNPNDIIKSLEVDATLSENVSFKKNVTQYPVESGIQHTDHAVFSGLDVTLTCIVSEFPPHYSSLFSPDEVVNIFDTNQPNKLVERAKEFLQVALLPEVMVNIDAKLGIFPGLSVTSVDYNASTETSGIFSFDLSLRKIIVSKSRLVDLPEMIEYKPGPTMQDKGSGVARAAPSTEPDLTTKEKDPKVEKEKRRTLFANLLKLFVDVVQKVVGGL